MKKETVYFLICLAVLLLAGVGVYFLTVSLKSSGDELIARVQLVPAGLFDNSYVNYPYFELSGELDDVDLTKNIFSLTASSTNLSPGEADQISFEKDKVYNFKIDEKTKIYQVNYADLFAKDDGQEIETKDLKPGDELVVIVSKNELTNQDNFTAHEIILKTTEENLSK